MDDAATLEIGDIKVFEKSFREHYSSLCTYAFRLLRSADIAEETVQDVFVHLWEKRREVVITTSLKSYLLRSVHNACLNKIKQTQRSPLTLVDRNKLPEIAETPTTKVYENDRDLSNIISEAVARLPEQCRNVFELNKIERLTYKEIAEHLEISVKTVENHMGSALKKLRKDLANIVYVIAIILYLLS